MTAVGEPLLEVKDLVKEFPIKAGFFSRQVGSVKAVSGVDFKVDEGPRRAGDPASITATGEKIRATLGWVPKHDSLREMVSTAIDWERYLVTRNR